MKKRRRLAHADRRDSILEVATASFAASGFDGARTSEIAKAAKVSEALLYKHFPSKEALYQAVLARVLAEQDDNFRKLQLPDASTAGLVAMLWAYLGACVRSEPGSRASEGQRLLLLSLAGDGEHAGLLYQRAQRIGVGAFRAALEASRREGNLGDVRMDPRNAWNFIEHVGSMISAGRLSGASVIPYSGSRATLLQDAVLFCGRGLGLKDAAIVAHSPDGSRRRR
jgi:AcrR family transcriptional regulator